MNRIKLVILGFCLLAAFSAISGCNITEKGEKDNVKYGVRGVWLTNVDSDVLTSKDRIEEAVNLVEELGLNTIFVVTWNKAMTMYPSKIMKEFTGVEIDPIYGNRDPLKELIETAHKKDIKVIAWFEFGFSSSFEENGGVLLDLKPEWSSKNKDGKLVTKNGFDWMNGFNPEVQDFVLSIICEVVKNYDVDGIQGDDRLPAMPSEAGYDKYTKELYKSAHNGETPPEDPKDAEWLNFRVGILNKFMSRIYDSVKAIDQNTIVSMAPSVYPWSKDEYLQDWPTWIENGNVELLCPQVYRYDLEDYKEALSETIKHAEGYNLELLAPGILIKVGDYCASDEYLQKMIDENRKHGLNGEVYFFFEGLKHHKELLKKNYDEKIQFPKIK